MNARLVEEEVEDLVWWACVSLECDLYTASWGYDSGHTIAICSRDVQHALAYAVARRVEEVRQLVFCCFGALLVEVIYHLLQQVRVVTPACFEHEFAR